MRNTINAILVGTFVIWSCVTTWNVVIAAPSLPLVTDVQFQPLAAQVQRVAQALESLGAPLAGKDRDALDEALSGDQPKEAVKAIQRVLDPLCLAGVNVNPESRVKAHLGDAPPNYWSRDGVCFLLRSTIKRGSPRHCGARVRMPRLCMSRKVSPNRRRQSRSATSSTAGWI